MSPIISDQVIPSQYTDTFVYGGFYNVLHATLDQGMKLAEGRIRKYLECTPENREICVVREKGVFKF